MGYDFEPWTSYPPLARDRLSIVANIIRDVWRTTLLLHDPSEGDNEWSLGCRVYARTCYALSEAARAYDWLTILEDEKPLRFGFAIGSVPFRFYHGEAGAPPSKYLMATYAELHQQQLLLNLDIAVPKSRILRLAVETDGTRQVSNIILVEMDEAGDVSGTYVIPFERVPENVILLQPKGVDLPPPPIEPLKQAEEEKREKRDAGAQ